MSKRKYLPILVASFMFTAFVNTGLAVQLNELTLEEKVARSELVIIGDVSKTLKNTADFGYDVAIVTPITVLKGTVTTPIRVAFNGPIAEARPDCCDLGGRYVFFITKNPKGDYYPVNGPLGIYRVDQD